MTRLAWLFSAIAGLYLGAHTAMRWDAWAALVAVLILLALVGVRAWRHGSRPRW